MGPKSNPYLFIVGCQRSGTGLLRRIIEAHPSIAMTRETHWIPSWFEKRKGVTPEGLITPELVTLLLAYPRFIRLEISGKELQGLITPGEPVSYSSFITGIFDLYGKAQGKTLVGDKDPRYVRNVSTLHALFPKARFIHLIRDGRDVCLSFINWRKTRSKTIGHKISTWNQHPVATAALWWKWHVQLGLEARSLLGPELYYEIRYESLVANPGAECEKLCAFLDVPYDDAMLRFHEGRTRNVSGPIANEPCLPITPGLRDWKSQMPAEHIEQFEAAAGDLLDELGYERACPCPRLKIQKQATGIRDLFTREARSITYQPPEHAEII